MEVPDSIWVHHALAVNGRRNHTPAERRAKPPKYPSRWHPGQWKLGVTKVQENGTLVTSPAVDDRCGASRRRPQSAVIETSREKDRTIEELKTEVATLVSKLPEAAQSQYDEDWRNSFFKRTPTSGSRRPWARKMPTTSSSALRSCLPLNRRRPTCGMLMTS